MWMALLLMINIYIIIRDNLCNANWNVIINVHDIGIYNWIMKEDNVSIDDWGENNSNIKNSIGISSGGQVSIVKEWWLFQNLWW